MILQQTVPSTMFASRCVVASSASRHSSSETPVATSPRMKSAPLPIIPKGEGLALICPSILNADLSRLGEECRDLLKCGADRLHLDVMDGHFVPNLTFGHPVVKCLRDYLGSGPFLDTHLMVANPSQWVKPMADSGCNLFTFHLEAVPQHEKRLDLFECIRSAGMQVGAAIKPGTPVSELLPYCSLIDLALVMTVEPGFGGQSFMGDMMPKVRRLRDDFPKLTIQVDGGVGPDTIDECAKAGADCIVSGTALVKSADRRMVIQLLRDSVNAAIDVRERKDNDSI